MPETPVTTRSAVRMSSRCIGVSASASWSTAVYGVRIGFLPVLDLAAPRHRLLLDVVEAGDGPTAVRRALWFPESV